MNVVYIDLETYSEEDLKLYGAIKYAKHKTTEIILVTYAIDDKPERAFCPLHDDTPLELLTILSDSNAKVISHNAMFEHAVFKYKPLPNWPDLPISRFIDPMILARSLNLPTSLEKLGEYYKIAHPKLDTGLKLIKTFSIPQNTKRKK